MHALRSAWVVGTLVALVGAASSLPAVAGPYVLAETPYSAELAAASSVAESERPAPRVRRSTPMTQLEEVVLEQPPLLATRSLRRATRIAGLATVKVGRLARRPPPPPPPPPPRPQPRVVAAPTGDIGDDVWDRLARCESGGNWQANTGNGFYGGLQFKATTWRSVGGTGLPHEHSREEQIHRAKILQARAGWGQWPHCSRVLGLR